MLKYFHTGAATGQILVENVMNLTSVLSLTSIFLIEGDFSLRLMIEIERSHQNLLVGAVAYAENFHGGGLVQGHMMVICIWCVLFVTSQFDVISMFPNQRFGEVC